MQFNVVTPGMQAERLHVQFVDAGALVVRYPAAVDVLANLKAPSTNDCVCPSIMDGHMPECPFYKSE